MDLYSRTLFSGNYCTAQTDKFSFELKQLKDKLEEADAILVGAGAGLSTAAGLTYSGKRFEKNFADFKNTFHITDMYSGGFYSFPDLETYWAWWSRHIWINRYEPGPTSLYRNLLQIVKDRNYFVLTTNVDHQFQLAGFDKNRLFYTQGDYGLFQCSKPCTQETYNNEALVRSMVEQQTNMRIPTALIPHCPHCGAPLTTNLRVDNSFVEDKGWYEAQNRYRSFVSSNKNKRILFLELGVGGNTPVIIKYPFWQMTLDNPQATYASINLGESFSPHTLESQSILINADIQKVLLHLLAVESN